MAKKTNKTRRPRLCQCSECKWNREQHRDMLIKNRYFIDSWHNKAFAKIAKELLQIRLYLDLEIAKRKKGGRQHAKKNN